MSKRAFEWYQYLAPLILAPLSFLLWWELYNKNLYPVLMAWLLPMVYAYIVPAVGTNVLKVWEFNTRLRLGRFRPHHGFVFGSVTAAIIWLCHPGQAQNGLDVFKISLISASVLGFWNIIYDILAIRSGFLIVYNQPWADGRGPEAVAMDYAPWFFGGFGAVYGLAIGGAELMLNKEGFAFNQFILYFPMMLVLSIVLPVWSYRWYSFRVHGHSGCKPVMRQEQ